MKILKGFSADIAAKYIQTGCIALALAVMAGAFGAHALQPLLDEKYIKTYQTAVDYHFYHGFALLLTGLLSSRTVKLTRLKWAARFFMIGLLLFCGSLYGLSSAMAAGNSSLRWLGAITPFGGLSFIVGWILLARAMYK